MVRPKHPAPHTSLFQPQQGLKQKVINNRLIALAALMAASSLFATAGKAAEDHPNDRAFIRGAIEKTDTAYAAHDAEGCIASTDPGFVFVDFSGKEKTHGKEERHRKLTTAFAEAANLAAKITRRSLARSITFSKGDATVVEECDTSYSAHTDGQVRVLSEHTLSRDLWVKSSSGWLERSRTLSTEAFTFARGAETLRAVLLFAPPVYDPGGPVCFVENWQADGTLLSEAEAAAAAEGAVLTRVVCPHSDGIRAAALTRRGYAAASEWYTVSLPLPQQPPAHAIRPLTAADVPRLLELGEAKRRQYQAYSPVFWHISALPRETFGPYLRAQIEDPEIVALAHERDGIVDGFVLANAQGHIDDFMVAAPELWPTVGAELLGAAGAASYGKGVSSLLVVCGQGDQPMRTMLAAQGLTPATDWYVRPLVKQQNSRQQNSRQTVDLSTLLTAGAQ